MDIKIINIKDLIPYENNPRKNEKAVNAVANSISEFGFKIPLIIDKNNVIVCGHTRLLAAKKLGITELPCIYADDLTDEQIRAFRLADNKTSELSAWDIAKMQEELEEIQQSIDMREFGFIIEEDNEVYISENDYENAELDLNDYDNENYQYECKCCGFRWGKLK